jgi:hypothetical protein
MRPHAKDMQDQPATTIRTTSCAGNPPLEFKLQEAPKSENILT